MYTSRSQPKLNAKMGLIIISILSLVNAGVGTVIAVKQNLPSVTPILTTGKPALEDFLTGNGTALSPPLYLCIITLLLLFLAFQPKWPGMVGVVGLTILGLIFLLGEFVEKNTYRVFNPLTFNLPVALDVLTEIILALLMITFGVIAIIKERQAHHQVAK
jgi:prolipoprotein diacylglyceryltransferase